jgi:hypothetical protein
VLLLRLAARRHHDRHQTGSPQPRKRVARHGREQKRTETVSTNTAQSANHCTTRAGWTSATTTDRSQI